MSINVRFSAFLRAEKILQKNISDLFSVTPQTISAITKNKSNLTIEHLAALVKEYPRINLNWLLTGEGKMYQDETRTPDILEEPNENYGFCMECVKKDARIELLNSQLKEKEEEIQALNREIGSLIKGGNDSNGDTRRKAAG